MRIFIVGIRHVIQSAEILCWSCGKPERFEQEQKAHFASLLQEAIAENAVHVVAEEARHGQETIAKRVCDATKCRYANIEIPPNERSARGILAGYNENPNTPPSDRE
jgi:hypothetical protein